MTDTKTKLYCSQCVYPCKNTYIRCLNCDCCQLCKKKKEIKLADLARNVFRIKSTSVLIKELLK